MAITYYAVHQKIYDWIDQGLWEFDGSTNQTLFTDLDKFIFELFGYKIHPSMMNTNAINMYLRFNDDVIVGKIDPRWIAGPHGLALWKVKVARETA